MREKMTTITISKISFIFSLVMLGACASSQTAEEKIMSSYCKGAYENLYKTYTINSDNAYSKTAITSAIFTAGDNYGKKDEFERLEKECN